MLQWIGLVCVLLMGAALGASMCGPPAAVTPMAAVAPAPSPAAPLAGPPAASGAPKAATPPTREERIVGWQLQEQEERTFHWERGWLRLEQVELQPDKTRVELTVFLQEGAADVFYVEVEGTLLVAGPWTGRATRSTFPSFAADRPHIKGYGAPRSARKESFDEETLLGVNSVARGTCNRTRGRRLWEAPSTMWRRDRLRPRALLARVWLRLRKKLPTEASYDGPPVNGRPRVELPEHRSHSDPWNFVQVGHPYSLVTRMSPVTRKAKSRARRTGRTYDHMRTLSV